MEHLALARSLASLAKPMALVARAAAVPPSFVQWGKPEKVSRTKADALDLAAKLARLKQAQPR
jgi:hypothetical protein